jgi:hypothetical protein
MEDIAMKNPIAGDMTRKAALMAVGVIFAWMKARD